MRFISVEDDLATVTPEVQGAGGFLSRYSGNLDIITAAAVRVGEAKARRLIGLEAQP